MVFDRDLAELFVILQIHLKLTQLQLTRIFLIYEKYFFQNRMTLPTLLTQYLQKNYFVQPLRA